MGLILSIIIGIVAGFVAGKLMRGAGFGLIVNLLLGIAGSLVGHWIADLTNINFGGIIGDLLISTGGAVLILFVVSALKK